MAMKDENGKFNSALLDYVQEGSVELMQSLLQNDNLDLTDLEGKTLLHYAAESNNVSTTQHFINKNQDVNIADNDGNSPLMLAVKKYSYDTAILLVKAGARIYSCSDESTSALLSEARFTQDYPESNGYGEFIKTVLQKLRNVYCRDEELLLTGLREIGCSLAQVISLRDANATRLMLKNGYAVDKGELPVNQTALHEAVYLGDLENVRVLLRFGASVHALDERQFTPLFYLFDKRSDCREDKEERLEIMKILIEHGALSSRAQVEPIRCILQCGGSLAMSALMQLDVVINYDTALTYLVENIHDDVLDVISGKNLNVNALYDGFSPLSTAVSLGSLRKVQFLLEHGADPNAVDDEDGRTPLLSALVPEVDSDLPANLLAIVQLLLHNGADAQYVFTDEDQEQRTVFDAKNTYPIRQQALESVVAHLAMIESCGETISDLIRQKIDSQDIYKQHFQVCGKQIEEMKNTTVNGRITLYKLLTDSHMVITRYARNPEFTAKFEKAMKDKRFLDPYYSISLHERVGKAIREARLREKAIVLMHSFFPCCFRNCTEIFSEILAYLTRDDLKNICKVR